MLDIADLKNGQKVLARQGVFAGPSAPVWGLWREREILVARRKKEHKIRGVTHPAGEIILLTLQDVNCADYNEQDYDPTFDMWVAENHYLQIKAVEEST